MYTDWEKEYETTAHWEHEPSKHIIEFLKYLDKGDNILDAGCGSGRDSILLAKKGFSVVGIEISNTAIEKAKKFAAEQNLKIPFKKCAVEKIDFPDEHFDKIYTCYVLHHSDLKKALHEFHRVLKPKGILFVVMFEKTVYEDGREQHKTRSHEEIISAFEEKFDILKQEVIEKDDDDQYGKHHHVKLVAVLRKK